jgi:hypothetical protein
MKENGLIIKCREEAFIFGKMEGDTKDNISQIKNMDMAFIDGMMGEVLIMY